VLRGLVQERDGCADLRGGVGLVDAEIGLLHDVLHVFRPVEETQQKAAQRRFDVSEEACHVFRLVGHRHPRAHLSQMTRKYPPSGWSARRRIIASTDNSIWTPVQKQKSPRHMPGARAGTAGSTYLLTSMTVLGASGPNPLGPALSSTTSLTHSVS